MKDYYDSESAGRGDGCEGARGKRRNVRGLCLLRRPALLPYDVGVKPYRPRVGLAIKALDFSLEAGKQVGGALEHF